MSKVKNLAELGPEFEKFAPKRKADQSDQDFEKEELSKIPLSYKEYAATAYAKDNDPTLNKGAEASSDTGPQLEKEVMDKVNNGMSSKKTEEKESEPKKSETLQESVKDMNTEETKQKVAMKPNTSIVEVSSKPEESVGNIISNDKVVSMELMNKLYIPFTMDSNISSIYMIEKSPKIRNFQKMVVDEFRLSFDTFPTVIPTIFEHFRKFELKYDKLIVDDVKLVSNPYNANTHYYDKDLLGIKNLIQDTEGKSRQYKVLNPAYHSVLDATTISEKNIEVGFRATIPIDEVDARAYRMMSELNFATLTNEDYMRQYLRLSEDEYIGVTPRPVDEELTFTKYFLRPVVKDQMRKLLGISAIPLQKLWSRWYAIMDKGLHISALGTSETFSALLNILETRVGQHTQANEVAKFISPGMGATFMKKLLTVTIWNGYYKLAYSFTLNKFTMSNLMECFAAKMLIPESCIDLESRRLIDNYICKWFIHKSSFGNKTQAHNGARYDINPGDALNPSPLLQGINDLLEAARIDKNSPEAVNIRYMLGTWSRVASPDPAEYSVIPAEFTDLGQTAGTKLPGSLKQFHNKEEYYYPVTSKLDTDPDVPSTTYLGISALHNLILSPKYRYVGPTNKVTNAFKSLVRHIQSMYDHIQYFSIEYSQKIVRKLSLIPNSFMMNEKDSRKTYKFDTIQVFPGDALSAITTIKWKESFFKADMLDLYIDGWNCLDSINRFISRINTYRTIEERIYQDFPIYGKYRREWDKIKTAYTHTDAPHPILSTIMDEYEVYKFELRSNLIQLRSNRYYRSKMIGLMMIYYPLMTAGHFGVGTKNLIIKPSELLLTRRETNVKDPISVQRTQPYKYFNVFSPIDYTSFDAAPFVKIDIQAHIDRIKSTSLNEVMDSNYLIEKVFYNIKIGQDQPEELLDELQLMGKEMKHLTVYQQYQWTDDENVFDVSRRNRYPILGSSQTPIVELPITEFGNDNQAGKPFYANHIIVRYPLSIITRVETYAIRY